MKQCMNAVEPRPVAAPRRLTPMLSLIVLLPFIGGSTLAVAVFLLFAGLGDAADVAAADRGRQHRPDRRARFYQRQTDVDGHTIGAEALMRWYHPRGNLWGTFRWIRSCPTI